MISPRQKFWIKHLKNFTALDLIVTFLLHIGIAATGSPHPNPATGQTVMNHMRRGGFYYLTQRQDMWSGWIIFIGVGSAVAALFAIRFISSYDPQSANLPPRSPNIDPFADHAP
jgi:hypothetical protein